MFRSHCKRQNVSSYSGTLLGFFLTTLYKHFLEGASEAPPRAALNIFKPVLIRVNECHVPIYEHVEYCQVVSFNESRI